MLLRFHNKLCSKLLILMLFLAPIFGWAQTDKSVVQTPRTSQQTVSKVPGGTVLVRGAVPSATDPETPMPESGGIVNNLYVNRYFHISYPIPLGWHEEFKGPPPSDRGYYVLAELQPAGASKDQLSGTILLQAQDLFFTLPPIGNMTELLQYMQQTLRPEYKVERPPIEIRIANHSFIRFDYVAPVAGLHFYVLATEIRCHAVEFVFTSRDPGLLEKLIQQMEGMKFNDEGNGSPVCIRDYAGGNNLTYKVDPVLKDRRFNLIPVRIIISKEGKVKHIHLISAFPDQAEIIKKALLQWTFSPYTRNEALAEVESGILFGEPQTPPAKPLRKEPKIPD